MKTRKWYMIEIQTEDLRIITSVTNAVLVLNYFL